MHGLKILAHIRKALGIDLGRSHRKGARMVADMFFVLALIQLGTVITITAAIFGVIAWLYPITKATNQRNYWDKTCELNPVKPGCKLYEA